MHTKFIDIIAVYAVKPKEYTYYIYISYIYSNCKKRENIHYIMFTIESF